MPKISELTATTTINSTDEFPLVQAGNTRKITIANLFSGYYTSATVDTLLTSHTGNTSNPHSVTATQVGNTIAQWNANQIQGIPVSATTPSTGQVLKYNGTVYAPAADNTGGGSSEDLTQFAGGVGTYYTKFIGNTSVGISFTANNARLVPVIIRRSCSLDRVRVNVSTAGAGFSANILLYTSTGTFLVDFGIIPATTTGTRETPVLTTPVSLSPGIYYFLVVTDGALSLSGYNNLTSPLMEILGTSGVASNSFLGGLMSFTFGTTPSPLTLPPMTSTLAPAINFRVSSLP